MARSEITYLPFTGRGRADDHSNSSKRSAAAVLCGGGLRRVCYLPSSYARDEESPRWALAWARNSFAFFSNVSTASAPAGQRSGGLAWLASWIRALASLSGSPPCRPFIFFQALTVS